jgi:hypothetical protein
MKEIKIEGVVSGATITQDEFTDKFIDFVEANGWEFGGRTVELDENGNEI